MNEQLLVALPWLHDHMPGAAGPRWDSALRLWPGLPNAPKAGWLCPDTYPFSPQEAAACAEDLRNMGEAALSGMPVVTAASDNAAVVRHMAENVLLAGFDLSDGNLATARAAEVAHRELLARQQAQKTLLWAWQQEERLLELSQLAEHFASTADGLTATLRPEPDRDGLGTDPLTEDLVRLSTPIALDMGLAPAWRVVVGNALFFLPPNAAIAMEGSLRENALEELDFSLESRWLSALEDADGLCTLEIRAPGWKLLGHTRPTGQTALDAERLWLAWRRAA